MKPNDQLANMTSTKIKLLDLASTKRQIFNPRLRDAELSQPLPALECRPTLVDTASPDEKGCLVLADGRLVAVLVRVAGTHIKQGGVKLSGWQMEAGFGQCAVPVPPLFDSLADAATWIRTQLSAR